MTPKCPDCGDTLLNPDGLHTCERKAGYIPCLTCGVPYLPGEMSDAKQCARCLIGEGSK